MSKKEKRDTEREGEIMLTQSIGGRGKPMQAVFLFSVYIFIYLAVRAFTDTHSLLWALTCLSPA